MRDLLTFFSAGNLEGVALSFQNTFLNNKSNTSTYSNETLNTEVKKSTTFRKWILEEYAYQLDEELNKINYNINQLPDFIIKSRPIFNRLGDKFSGTQILINDTEKTEIKLLHYSTRKAFPYQKFYAYLEVIIYDHFGLDRNDAVSYQDYNGGFATWWLLQHRYGYVPFRTKIKFRIAIQTKD
ncbi:DUF3289 family protein [Pedobacter paludis]|uniref:DUF3289 domain-containing protein n=1 Tax=Pedobacter paludis TaxID=2203212 RepID=A0A317EVV2_9SPHI|nr:DUF3289 family protein [Pedobacter paludis]PWS30904.1 hypothetical protein DF947_14970 [Pedobacter paludis]